MKIANTFKISFCYNKDSRNEMQQHNNIIEND